MQTEKADFIGWRAWRWGGSLGGVRMLLGNRYPNTIYAFPTPLQWTLVDFLQLRRLRYSLDKS